LTSATALTSAVDTFKSQLVDLLGIPTHLVGSGDVPLPVAYQKYKAFLVACLTLDNKVAEGKWTVKRPSQTDLIELFVSKSFFHSHYPKHFSKVADYPEMVAWLDGDSESADIDVWGVQKVNYTFSDLSVWLENGGRWESDSEDESKVKRGKGKGKEKGLRKGKGKEKELDKGKGREKDLGKVRKHKKRAM
jgi:hypothetical protein